MIKEAIAILVSGNSLSKAEAATVMEEIMERQATTAQLGAFLTALRIKGETAEEIAGLASVMRSKATTININEPLLDIVGTGGDGLNTFNISTTAAFVIAGAGVKVARHGNRAASSRCGSADVLEALGVNIELNAEQVKRCIEQAGIGFMFAPIFHPAMKYVAAIRKEIGIRTVFNILGPLTNPAGARHLVIGVPSIELGDKIIAVFPHLDVRHALVVHGLNGMDELSISGRSVIWEIKDGKILRFRDRISSKDAGLKTAPLKSVEGGTVKENAQIMSAVLTGAKTPQRDVVLLNAAAALLAADKVDTLVEGVHLSAASIDSGKAMVKLKQLVEVSQSLKKKQG